MGAAVAEDEPEPRWYELAALVLVLAAFVAAALLVPGASAAAKAAAAVVAVLYGRSCSTTPAKGE